MIVNQQYLIAVLLVLILKMKLKFGQTAKTLPTKILVIGGSGRVGGSAVRSIANRFGTSVEILVGGRKRDNWDAYMKHQNMSILKTIKFLELDITDDVELKSIVETVDLVIHTAGPFQGIKVPNVMETALLAGKKYLDVCDDVSLSRICRSNYYTSLAQRTGGSAIISTGIWPGGSSIFAQEVISRAGGASNVDKVVFSFFTAGSGNAGPTILTATFLILGENVLTYVDGKEVLRKSATDIKVVDFGKDIGEREVVRLNLIECESCYSSGIGNVETFFGTAPKLWNRLFVLMAQLIPQNVLRDRSMMANLANLSLPLVRLIDKLVGSTNGKYY